MLADGQLFFVVRTRGTTGRSGSDTGGTSLVLEQNMERLRSLKKGMGLDVMVDSELGGNKQWRSAVDLHGRRWHRTG